MTSPTKKINKRLIGFIIWWTILWITWLSSTEKWRGILGRLLHTVLDRGRWLLQTAERLGEKIAKRP